MATISDTINQGLERLSTSPLGMASLGLLMQPSMSRTPINPFQYAAQGMQLGIQNRQAKQQALAQQEQGRAQQEMQRAQYLMEIQKYQQEELRMRQAQEERARQEQAMQEFMSTLSPEERKIAAVMGRDYATQMMQQRMQRPTSLEQNLTAAGLERGTPEFQQAMMTAINRPQVQIGGPQIKPPTGYMLNPEGTGVVPIPGMPPIQKELTAEQKILNKIEEEKQQKASTVESVNYIAREFFGSKQNPGAIDRVSSGGFMNYKSKLAPYIDKKDKDYFESLQRQLSSQLRAIFRIPGEGSLSDKEQADYQLMLPSIQYDPETNKKVLSNLLNIIKIRVGQNQGSNTTSQPGSTTTQGSQVKGYPRGTVRERR